MCISDSALLLDDKKTYMSIMESITILPYVAYCRYFTCIMSTAHHNVTHKTIPFDENVYPHHNVTVAGTLPDVDDSRIALDHHPNLLPHFPIGGGATGVLNKRSLNVRLIPLSHLALAIKWLPFLTNSPVTA